jgi:hypothetical protein
MLRFGKLSPERDKRTLRLEDYLSVALPPPPDKFNVLDRVYNNLKESESELFPMDGNDKYGDCTIAAVAHADTIYDSLTNTKLVMKESDVIKLYLKLSGGEDTGLVELDVLKYWRKNIINGDKIYAFTSLNHRNHNSVKQAIYLFGGIYLGFQVPENCMDEFNNHKIWTEGELTNSGHAVYAVSYDEEGITVLTWGTTQKGTWNWWDKCVDETYVILPDEARDNKFGVDFNQLKKDLQIIDR